jgi:DNA-binding XRE family transcriptional regulator
MSLPLIVGTLHDPVTHAIPFVRQRTAEREGWSQSDLAAKIGINRTTLIDVEAGKREPQPITLTAVVKGLTSAGIVFTEKCW